MGDYESIEDIVLRHSGRGMNLLRRYIERDYIAAAARGLLRQRRGRFPRRRGPEAPYVTLSLFLPRPLPDLRGGAAVEPYPGRFTNHLPLSSPADLDESLWAWMEEARQFRNPPGHS